MSRSELPAFFFLCVVMLLASAAVAVAGPLTTAAPGTVHLGAFVLPCGIGLVVVALIGRPPAPHLPPDDLPD